MRFLAQPGPVHPSRIDSFTGHARRLAFTAEPGTSLLEALTIPLTAAGFTAATLRFSGATVDPFRYVMPDHAADGSHVAYFSPPRAPAGVTRINQARATFGFNQGRAFLHCHASWTEPDGQVRGGHILNDESILTAAVDVEAWGFDALRIEVSHDAETNFALFQPLGESRRGGNAVLARVRPNVDIIDAVETIARQHAMPNATIVGSVGSLIGTRFQDGRTTADHATEVLVTRGRVRDGTATMDLTSVDMAGQVHEGRLLRGENPVCITFDLVLVRDTSSLHRSGGQSTDQVPSHQQ